MCAAIITLDQYKFHTEPYGQYQLDGFLATRDKLTYAYFWEQGLGKTWLMLNVARYNFEVTKKIDAMIVTAPNGVHKNWEDECLKHLPPDMDYEVLTWWPSTASGYWEDVKRTLRQFVGQTDKFLILATSYHAFLQDRSWRVIRQFMQERKVLWALDESDDIGNPSAKSTRRILRIRSDSVLRRIGTGTPYKDGTPLSYYSQFKFLHDDILNRMDWKQFRLKFAEWEFRELPGRPYKAMIPKKDYSTGRQKFINLDYLEKLIARRSLRMTKDEALPDLPAKEYDKLYVQMTPRQSEVYARLEAESELDWGADRVSIIEMAMIARLRRQQVLCGFYPRDGDEPETRIPGDQPRMEAVVEEAIRAPGQVIVWARFTMSITMICEELARRGTILVRYDGAVIDRERERAKQTFLRGDAKVFVSNPAAAARGHTFVNSRRAIFHSNHDRLLLRVQAEDRQHRIGQHNSVLYTDTITPGTVDMSQVAALRAKMDVGRYLMGLPPKEWL